MQRIKKTAYGASRRRSKPLKVDRYNPFQEDCPMKNHQKKEAFQ